MAKPDYITTRDMDLPMGSDRNTMMHVPEGTPVFLLYWVGDEGKPPARAGITVSEYGKLWRVSSRDIRKRDA